MSGTAARCSDILFGASSVENPVSAAIIEDDELIKKVYSNTRYGTYFVGEAVEGLRVRFADVAVYKAHKKGTYVPSLTAKMDGANEITSTGDSAAADVISATVTGGVVVEAVECESTNGEPIEYSVIVLAAKVGSTEGGLAVT